MTRLVTFGCQLTWPSVCRSNLFLIEYLSIGTQRVLKIPTPPFDIICILGSNTKSWILFCLHTYVIILIHSPPPMPSVTLTHLQLPSPILETVPVGGFWLREFWPFVWARGPLSLNSPLGESEPFLDLRFSRQLILGLTFVGQPCRIPGYLIAIVPLMDSPAQSFLQGVAPISAGKVPGLGINYHWLLLWLPPVPWWPG